MSLPRRPRRPAQNIKGRTLSGKAASENTALDYCYRQIGISAVAAAARYQGSAKNPAYAPVEPTWREPAEAAAA
jgi:hypothetical protein